MALTPGMASAALVSMRVTRACGLGLSSSLANSMPVGAEVFGVFGATGDFRDQVGRRVVLAD